MARYFFNFYECGKLFPADESVELPDMAAVHDLALAAARDLMAAEIRKGELCLSCRIEVLDKDQRPVLLLPFKEAVTLSGL